MSTIEHPIVLPINTVPNHQTHVMAGVLIAVAGSTFIEKIRTKRQQRYSRIEGSRRQSRIPQFDQTEQLDKHHLVEQVTEIVHELPPYEQCVSEPTTTATAPSSPVTQTVDVPASSPPPYRLTTSIDEVRQDEQQQQQQQPSTPIDKKRKSIDFNLRRLSSSLKFTTPDILAGVSAAHDFKHLLPWSP
jgi:hypothetical protein